LCLKVLTVQIDIFGNDFFAYENNYKRGGKMTKDMTLFLDKTSPYYFTFSTNIRDAQFFKGLLESLQSR